MMKTQSRRETFLLCAAVLLSLLVFVILTEMTITGRSAGFDAKVEEYLRSIESSSLTTVNLVITHSASSISSAIISLALALFALLRRKSRRVAFVMVVTAATNGATNVVLKNLIGRERPSNYPWLTQATGFSYPSGHTQSAVVIAGLFIILTRGMPLRVRRFLLIPLLWLWVTAVALSRVYLGVHYASDVLGGFAAGMVFSFCAIGVSRREGLIRSI